MNVGRMIKRTKFKLKAHSPEILMIAGVAGVVVSFVMACKASMKVKDILQEHNDEMDVVRKIAEESPEEYSEADVKKDTTIVYSRTALKIGKAYAPAVILGTASLVSIVASNNILRKRNAALTAAYFAINKGFKEYRDRVVDRFGKEVDHQLRYGIKAREIEETVTDEKGKEKKKKQQIFVADAELSGYARYFTRSNSNWQNDEHYIQNFLSLQQKWANEHLKAYGYITLNEVYRALGFAETKAGMIVGWIFDPKNPTGDNYVEFDVKEVCIPNEMGGFERAYAIDFNVDGNIFALMAS